MSEIIEGHVVPDNEEPVESGALVPTTPPATLVGTNDPDIAIERLTKTADALKGLVDAKGLVADISGKEYPTVAAWQTLGVLLGVTAITVWTKPLADGEKTIGWEARVEARTLDGKVVGAAESMCTRDERNWRTRDDNALRSMAQTRATSKAMRGPLGFVMQLAGYEATPAEEMPAGNGQGGGGRAPARPAATAAEPEPTEKLATAAQRRLLFARAKQAELTDEKILRAILMAIADTPHSDRIPASKIDALLEHIEDWRATLDVIHSQAEAGDPKAKQIVEQLLDEG